MNNSATAVNKNLLRVLITGGNGMLGRNIHNSRRAKDFIVMAPNRAELDLTDYAATLSWMKKNAPDVVVHCAGLVGGIHTNMAHPVDFMVTNIDLARNVMLASRQTGVKQLLNIASSCMYPRNAVQPIIEDSLLTGAFEPTNEGYAIAKTYATRLCQYIHCEDSQFTYKTLVPCNLYGPYDKFESEKSHLLPAIIHKIHQAKKHGLREVVIWGDGTARREFMFAGDLADAIFSAINDIERLPEIMNIGLGYDFSVNDYYQSVAEVIQWEGTFAHDTSKPVGVLGKLTDITRLQAWGWKASTSLQDGIRQTYDYYKTI